MRLKNMKTFPVSSVTRRLSLTEHFPKPYTKAEQRMFKIDDSKLSETTDEEEEDSQEEDAI